MQPALLVLAAITLVSLLLSVYITKRKIFGKALPSFTWLATVLQFCVLLFAILNLIDAIPVPVSSSNTLCQTPSDAQETEAQASDIDSSQAVSVPFPSDPRLNFAPVMSDDSDPGLFQINWEIGVEDQVCETYMREDPICFELDQDYFALPGIATFRGNNYRSNASYGTAVIEQETMEIVWSHRIGNLNKWGGCAWTGQPLAVQWDAETKAIMDTMYDSKKSKEGLVEVIYATLDGYIHFYDLDDGSKTRDPIYIGMNFKGAGSLDPRGYPLLYVGAGLYTNGAPPRMFVVNLITGKIIYTYGNSDPFANRDWSAFDSSPLVDAQTDTLIWPGENGILYTIKLNTEYDKEAGTISISPDDPVKSRYTSAYSEDQGRYLGYETSAAIVDQYFYAADKSGLFQCVNLNTMELVWAQDIKDESSSSPVFEWGDDCNGYIYTASSLHWTVQENNGSVSIYKLDASTGRILWEYERECVRYDDIAGGVQCTPLLGKKDTNIDGLIIYSIGRTPSAYRGVLIALDTDTGEKIWEISSGNYAWSSPVALYTEDGNAYIFLANASGIARLIDGSTGEVLATLDFDETVEASPVVFGNMLVIGSREGVYGIKIS